MARSFSQSLIRTSNWSTIHHNKPYRIVPLRNQSSHSEYPHPAADLDSSDTEIQEAVSLQGLEDAIHRIIVRRSAPDWLPFRPGSSYWVPPRRYGIAQLVHRLVNNLTEEEAMSLTSPRGWPSFSYFVDGVSHMMLRYFKGWTGGTFVYLTPEDSKVQVNLQIWLRCRQHPQASPRLRMRKDERQFEWKWCLKWQELGSLHL